MKKLLLIGSNLNLRHITDIANYQGYDVQGIIDQDYWQNQDQIDNYRVVGGEKTFDWQCCENYFIAVNWTPDRTDIQRRNYLKRRRMIELSKFFRLNIVTLIHPRARVPESCSVGPGVLIGADALIGHHCQIRNFSQIRDQSYLAHHVTIGEGSVIQVQSYVGAGVSVGHDCYLGVKSCIVPKQPLSIPDHTFVKSNALVSDKDVKNLPRISWQTNG